MTINNDIAAVIKGSLGRANNRFDGDYM